jgi:hypothetical protein
MPLLPLLLSLPYFSAAPVPCATLPCHFSLALCCRALPLLPCLAAAAEPCYCYRVAAPATKLALAVAHDCCAVVTQLPNGCRIHEGSLATQSACVLRPSLAFAAAAHG